MEEYREIGLKLTPQRLAIFEYLKDNKEHPSAEDIYREVKKKFPTMSFATVYNTLNRLLKKAKVHELTIDSERKRYDPDTAHHHHIICIKCKKIVDARVDYTISVPDEQRRGFDVIDNHIEFYGICPDCKSN